MGQLEDMQIFIRIVEAGSITKASEQLNLAKSAVSRRLNDLEERLGVQLLTRTTRQSHLTDAGKYYYQQTKNILEKIDELNEETTHSLTTVNGTLRMTVPLSFGLIYFSDIIDEFSKEHPNLNFELDFSDRIVDLVEEGFELAIRINKLEDSTYQAKRLTPIKFVLCASPDYLKNKGTPQKIDDLKNHTFLQYSLDKSITLTLTDPQGITHQLPVTSKIKATNGEFLVDMAIKNHGITYIPTFIAYNALKNGKLIPLLTEYKLPSLTAYAVYPRNRFLSLRCRYLIDYINKRFSNDNHWNGTF
ncbi:LysR family transcriptional regulator [Bisgaardia hudsonensis]|uniref:LysR family transcriptional regulator n=1 Tax=Bisgaardia hudsonensis TaxID=109472 RepID=A0A4R2N1P9_9PAST|nr:LysR family transcriptional regulator [Bisgaardia hudsonensis]QLB12984.1 LysR family transcriptional regulator [Bisgaardia hudsonensis]TCP13453.1 LysR family transcriptional regulator [Bisgaardia hudsonensis]